MDKIYLSLTTRPYPHPDWFKLCKNTNRNELIKEMCSILKKIEIITV